MNKIKFFIKRLNDLNYSKRFITLEFKREQEEISNGGNTTIDSKSFREEEETCGIQSLLVKERDIEYQVISRIFSILWSSYFSDQARGRGTIYFDF